MPFCSNCGKKLEEGVKFCGNCGTPVKSEQSYEYAEPAECPYDFSKVKVRYCCPNKHVFDGTEDMTVCPTCKALLNKGGYIQMYRMGRFSGCAVGMGIYIDSVPFGHIGNKQSLRISVPYGKHQVHATHTTTHLCNDPVFEITPAEPYVWCKAQFSPMGYKININPADPTTMPKA